MENFYFVIYVDGRIERVEGELNPENLGHDVESAYTVATVFKKQSVFKSESLVAKTERRIRMADGTMKFKHEMTADELAWYSNVRKEAAKRAVQSRKANATAA